MPFTNIISGCTPAFKAALRGVNSIVHGMHGTTPCSFYVFDVKPPTPWTLATLVGVSDLMTSDEFKNAALVSFRTDPTIVQLITDDHSNIRGNHDVEYMLRLILHFANISTCSIRRRGRFAGPPIIAHRILIPPFSLNAATNQLFQDHLMSIDFRLPVPRRGVATPWRGPDPRNPMFMSCQGCYGVDHYVEDCAIVNSPGYRATHGIPEEDATASSSSVPTSLTAAPTGTPANTWVQVPFRGAGRGRGRARGGRNGPPRGGGRAHRGGYGGYMPYY